MKIQAGTVTQEHDITAGTTFLNVPWQILDDSDALVLDGAQAFPLETAADDIKDFLTRTLANYVEKKATETESRAAQAAIDEATAVAGEVSNLEITQ